MHETGFAGFYTQQEHATNWFHIKKINGLEDMPFSSQRVARLALFGRSVV